ncbi:MAG: ABC transporter ATP-binding protein [Polyangia bacterium]
MTSAEPTAVVVRGVSFAYRERAVLKEVSFEARSGRLTVLLGPNGSGKSTLLRLIARTLDGGTGLIEIMGRGLHALSGAERAGLIGYLPQSHQPVFGLSVEDVVLTGRAALLSLMPRPRDRAAAAEAMATVGIEHLRGRPYTNLSGGERHLVLLARVIAQQPRIILLDEPFAHLDLANQIRLLGIVGRLTREGVAVVAVMHDPNLAFQHGEDFVFLRQGEIVPVPVGAAPWDQALLATVYGVQTRSVPFEGRALIVPLARQWQSKEEPVR